MERHKFASLARQLSEIESQLTTLATKVGALHITITTLLSANHDMIDTAVGHDVYQRKLAANMARDLIEIEGLEGVRKYFTRDQLWDWEKWEMDNLALRWKTKDSNKELQELSGGVGERLDQAAREEARQEWVRDVEGRSEGEQQEMPLDPALFETP